MAVRDAAKHDSSDAASSVSASLMPSLRGHMKKLKKQKLLKHQQRHQPTPMPLLDTTPLPTATAEAHDATLSDASSYSSLTILSLSVQRAPLASPQQPSDLSSDQAQRIIQMHRLVVKPVDDNASTNKNDNNRNNDNEKNKKNNKNKNNKKNKNKKNKNKKNKKNKKNN
jgi:hypothetical protein